MPLYSQISLVTSMWVYSIKILRSNHLHFTNKYRNTRAHPSSLPQIMSAFQQKLPYIHSCYKCLPLPGPSQSAHVKNLSFFFLLDKQILYVIKAWKEFLVYSLLRRDCPAWLCESFVIQRGPPIANGVLVLRLRSPCSSAHSAVAWCWRRIKWN